MSADFTTWNLDVHDFGAVGDGKANGFAAIQAAITEAQLSRKLFTSGLYRILSVTNYKFHQI